MSFSIIEANYSQNRGDWHHDVRKFGIFSDNGIYESLYLSGNLDLSNFTIRFNEISGDKKLNEKKIFLIEKEFNDYMLSDAYVSFFDFSRFKEFLKSVLSN